MTTNEELGRRLVACKRWRWIPGMAAVFPEPVGAGGAVVYNPIVRVADGTGGIDRYRAVCHWYDVPKGCIPFLEDPATLGCLLGLVREAWGDDGIAATIVRDARDGDYWHLIPVRHKYPAFASTEAEALVKALEAAP